MRYLLLLVLASCTYNTPTMLKHVDKANLECIEECKPREANKVDRNIFGGLNSCSCKVE